MKNVEKQFDAVANDYDKQRQSLIPCFNDFYGVAIENLVLENEEPVLMDIGAGTGLFSEMVLQKYPLAHIELIDISNEMLQMAKQRLVAYPNVRTTKININDVHLANNQYDAVISSLAIHHLTDEEKKNIYQKIYHGLKSGGIFLHAEQVLAANGHLTEVYHNTWVVKITKSGLSDEVIKQALERVKLDKRTALDTQLGWLTEIGFRNVDCLYKYYDFVVMKAEKQPVA